MKLKHILISLLLTILFFAILIGIGALLYRFPYISMGILMLALAVKIYCSIFSSVEHYEDDDFEGW